MLDAIKHITDDNFSFRKTGHRCIVRVTQSNWVENVISCFSVLPGSAEAQVIWRGIVKRLLITYFIGNISAKTYQNPFMCVKAIASQRWDVFLRHSVYWGCVPSVSRALTPTGLGNDDRSAVPLEVALFSEVRSIRIAGRREGVAGREHGVDPAVGHHPRLLPLHFTCTAQQL